MKYSFGFTNLCGTVFKGGNVLFTPDGNSVVSPVGNRVSVYNLVDSTSRTLGFENHKDIHRIALSPNGSLLLTIDTDGHAFLVNFHKAVVLHTVNFGEKVRVASFSPCGAYFAVGVGNHIKVYRTPTLGVSFCPLTLHHKYTGHSDHVVSLDWSSDSSLFVTGSKDGTARVYSTEISATFIPSTLSGLRDAVIAVFFSSTDEEVYLVARDGAVHFWKMDDPAVAAAEAAAAVAALEAGDGGDTSSAVVKSGGARGRIRTNPKWRLQSKRYFQVEGTGAAGTGGYTVTCSAFLRSVSMLVVGFSTGTFGLYELPDLVSMHTLSMTNAQINTVSVNETGEWLAFGSTALGQLLVWEWQSETYVLKQQGHFYDLNVAAYSPDGQVIATGGDDNKVKLWNVASGFCFVTFTQHTAPVTAVAFLPSGQAVLSASMDGTVRAHDLVRYRNFRTMTSNTPCQFCSLAVDPSGDIVCAGSLDKYSISVWSMQSGRLLDVLAAHEAPVAALSFSPSAAVLCSGSWDTTVRFWDVFESKGNTETLSHQSDVVALAYRPDGDEICTACLDGQLYVWDVQNATLKGQIDGQRDIRGGRGVNDRFGSKSALRAQHFTTLCYTADGECVLAGGRSRFVCLYHVSRRVLLRKYQVSGNRSLDGVLDFQNSANLTAAGPLDAIEDAGNDSDDENELRLKDRAMPGAARSHTGERTTRPEIRTKCVQFAPTGLQWAAATTEGLLIYSRDTESTFNPVELQLDVTPANVAKMVDGEQYGRALTMALCLNEDEVVNRVLDSIPLQSIQLVVEGVPTGRYVSQLLTTLAARLESSRLLEWELGWLLRVLRHHGEYIRAHSLSLQPVLRSLQRSLMRRQGELSAMCSSTQYTAEYLCQVIRLQHDGDGSSLTDGGDAEEDGPLLLEGGEEDGEDDEGHMDELTRLNTMLNASATGSLMVVPPSMNASAAFFDDGDDDGFGGAAGGGSGDDDSGSEDQADGPAFAAAAAAGDGGGDDDFAFARNLGRTSGGSAEAGNGKKRRSTTGVKKKKRKVSKGGSATPAAESAAAAPTAGGSAKQSKSGKSKTKRAKKA